MNSEPPAAGSAVPNAEQSAEQSNDKPRKRIPLASIPVTISIGLLIAALYLGARIFTAHPVQKAAPAMHPVAAPVAAPAVAAPAPHVAVEAAKAMTVTAPPPEIKPATQPVQVAPKPPAIAAKPGTAVPAASDAGDQALPMIQPHSGERYIQVGALDPDAQDTRHFVERLRGEGLDPHVAEGPTPVLMRVLIGPFSKSDALNEKKAQIESEGIETFVREY
jgi:cell division septation protein DedD